MRQGVFDTLYMTIPATFFAYVLGLPLGVLLVITSPGHIRPNATLNSAVGTVVNFLRSIPFIILLVMLFDVTRVVMGTAIGTRSVIFPLFVSAFRRAGELAMAMEARCYHGGENRTRLRKLEITKNDYLAYGAVLALMLLIVLEGVVVSHIGGIL